MKISEISKTIFSIFFPKYCLGCNQIINEFEDFLCVDCAEKLEPTDLHFSVENIMTRNFLGKLPLLCATSLFYFQKEGVVQELLHQLKYKGREEIGEWLGKWLGNCIKEVPHFQQFDMVVGVPMHPEKQKKRGYNQVTLFGIEIAKSLQIDYAEDILKKVKNNTAQARNNWLARQKSSRYLFEIQYPEKIKGKKILLVDDVITTGGTIISCANELLKVEGVSVGIASIAYVADY